MLFFTADTHFGHAEVIRLCCRPFETLEEMDERMIKNWNERVEPTDSVYVLGDMFFRCEDPEAILRRLHGRKHLISGNHDSDWMQKADVLKYFASAELMAEISDGTRAMTVCHYPLMTWKHHARSYMVHGHIHENTATEFWPYIKGNERILNAGVDVNGFRPVTFDEMLANNISFKAAH